MPSASGRLVARLASEIMFSDQYLALLGAVYSDQTAIGEFEASPKDYLLDRGIRIPDVIEVRGSGYADSRARLLLLR